MSPSRTPSSSASADSSSPAPHASASSSAALPWDGDLTTPRAARSLWHLDDDIVFLNHGSFGACPKAVLAVQDGYRTRLEREPIRFMVRELEGLLDAARTELAAFVGARPDDLVFVPNATTGVNAVLRSLDFAPGDEIVVTDHGYNACTNAAEFVAARTGAKVVRAALPIPLAGDDAVVERVLAAVTPRTKLAMIDHVTSPSGLVLPVAALVRKLAERGVDLLVDGAHAPGMLPLDLGRLGAAYYTGNLHKWVCAPKGAAFLWVREDRRDAIRPHVISHGANATRTDRSRLHLEFDWTGTSDPSALLSVPAALEFLRTRLPGGWPEVMAANRSLAIAARTLLDDALELDVLGPASMLGSLAALVLPLPPVAPLANGIDPLQDALFTKHRIEVPVMTLLGRRLLRVSAQLYDTLDEYRVLADALRVELPAHRGPA
ncbi:MAG: aminotransferase class V-fold PLP-dependent enzyme [Planctomycetes bacterium]|nr:aminotransferase class V-fold PLP-dependent enzyme [Planctomycetota bacterium]